MPGVSPSGVLKTWLYAAASVLLGSWAAPFLYNAGKALAEVSQSKATNGPLEWLAEVCRHAGFPQFFAASLLVAGVILFLPFIDWVKSGNAREIRSFLLPRDENGRRLMSHPRACGQAGIGFLMVAALFLLLAMVLGLAGVLQWKNPAGPVFPLIWRGFFTALGLAIFQEILFRGIATGIFLRAMRPAAAIGMAALLFALVHFLNPPPGLSVVDPDASGVGFELLRAIAGRLFQPRVQLDSFAPLLALGAVLAYARWSTASLGLPIGLHTGWIFIHILLGHFTTPHQASTYGKFSGSSLMWGIVPIVSLLFIGWLVSLFTTPRDATDLPT